MTPLGAEAPRQPIADQAGDDVNGAAAGKADEDFHRPVRIVERQGSARNGRQRGSACCQTQEFATGKVHIGPHELECLLKEKASEPRSIYFGIARLPEAQTLPLDFTGSRHIPSAALQ